MLIDLNILSLEHHRQVSSITLLYKVVHNPIDICSVDLIPVQAEDMTKDFTISMQRPISTVTHSSLDQ